MRVKHSVTGLRELQGTFEDLHPRTRKAAFRRAVMDAAEPMVETARALAPRRTGDLAESIGVSDRLSKGASQQGGSRTTVYFGAGPLKQAVFQEFGTVNHAPQPFIRPAFDQHKAALVPELAKSLRAELLASAARSRR